MKLRNTIIALLIAALAALPIGNLYAANAMTGAQTAKAGTGGVTKGTFVKLSSAGVVVAATATSDKIVGVCELTTAANGLTRYAPAGTLATVTSGELIAVGDLLTTGTGGKAFVLDPDTGASQRLGGIAMTAATGADEDVVILVQGGAAGAATALTGDITIADGKNLTVGSALGGPAAGYVNIFSTTAAKGELRLSQPDDANNKITTVQANNAAANATITQPTATATLATTALVETLTNKTLTSPTINTPVIATPAITGGTAIELTGFSLRSSGAAFDLLQATTEALSADRTITWTVGDNNRSITLGGNITTAANFVTVGGHSTTLTTTGVTNVTLPTTGTLATIAGTETITGDKTFTGVVDLSGGTITYRDIVNADIGASAAIARSKLATDSGVFVINVGDLRNDNGSVMDASGGAGLFSVGCAGMGTGTLSIDGEAASNNSKTDTLMFEFALPPSYVAAGTVTISVKVKESVGAATVATTLSAEVYEDDGEGGVSANLAGAPSVTDVTEAWQTSTIAVTATSLVAGDKIRVFLKIVTNDTGGAVGTIAQIGGKPTITCQIKG